MDQIKLYNLLRNALKMTDHDAEEFVFAAGKVAERRLDAKIQTLATKDDIQVLSEKINTKIFVSGLVQIITIVGSILAIVKFIK